MSIHPMPPPQVPIQSLPDVYKRQALYPCRNPGEVLAMGFAVREIDFIVELVDVYKRQVHAIEAVLYLAYYGSPIAEVINIRIDFGKSHFFSYFIELGHLSLIHIS